MTKRIVHRLDMLKSAQLLDYIRTNYAESKLTDEKFAEKAAEEFGYPVLASQVEKRRVILGIPPTSNRPAHTNLKALFELIQELELRVSALEKKGA